ncbi:2,3-bisphosphoglycerate-independent phosphoglycerate mutase [bacterium]|nr:2,3-bisphosphoglycerate-independent phosphoglycerate mutase [bacterium]
MNKKVLLIILDGFGEGEASKFNAIANANKPFIDKLNSSVPKTTIKTSGLDVGLPDGQMGNSEVGHTNIGAGRVVYQDYTRISKSIKDGEFQKNSVILDVCKKVAENGKTLHVMGLFSDGGVHSDNEHLKAIVETACKNGVKSLKVHAFLDGRDTPPQSAPTYFKDFDRFLENFECLDFSYGVISGRFYAMDRDKRWDRVSKAYLALTKGECDSFINWSEGLDCRYNAGETDEFVTPFTTKNFKPITNGDAIFFYNFRSDRAREISHVFLDENFSDFDRGEKIELSGFVSMTEYEKNLPTQIAFPPVDLTKTLGEIISSNGLKQLRIAETEKYAHVTFFFNGGVESKFEGEERILIPSPKEVKTYDLKPQMSAFEVTDALVKEIQTEKHNLIVLNYANGDMVGHTGIYEAAIKAIEAVDKSLSILIPEAEKHGYSVVMCADHGNSEMMWDEEANAPHTQHTTGPVPFWVMFVDGLKSLKTGGALKDVAPTILDIMGIEKPIEMEGISLIER